MTAVSTDTSTSPRAMTIAGWTLSGLFIAFMIFDVTLTRADPDSALTIPEPAHG